MLRLGFSPESQEVRACYHRHVVNRISTVLCQVLDMDRATNFYRSVLGLTPGVVSPFWSDFTVGTVKIGLHPLFKGGEREVGRGWILGLEVDSLPALRERLEGDGVTCGGYHDVPGGCVMEFADTEGNPIQAMQVGVTARELPSGGD